MKVTVNVSYASESIKLEPSSNFSFESNVDDSNNHLSSMIEQMVAARDQSIAFIEQIAKAQRAAQPQSANKGNNKKKSDDEDGEDEDDNGEENEDDGDEDDVEMDNTTINTDEDHTTNPPQKKKQKL